MTDNFLIIADLGSAGNLVRNILLLSDDVDFPLGTNRKKTILAQFTPDLSQWLPTEYRLRFWNQYYGVDLSDHLDISAYAASSSFKDKPVVFLNHSAFWEPSGITKFNAIIVRPTTDLGFKWQVRSYCEKKGVDKLHNFSFPENVEESKGQFISEHGVDAYYRLNVLNFYEISKHRQQQFSGVPELPLELLINNRFGEVCEILENTFGITLPRHDVREVLESWNACHWPKDETENWKYYK